MINILFWNTGLNGERVKNKDKITACLRDLVKENKIDLLILAEYIGEIQEMCNLLNLDLRTAYKPIPNNGGCGYIKGVINSKYRIELLSEESRYQIVKISTTTYVLLIAMIHSISKLCVTEEEQRICLHEFHKDIEEKESEHKCKNSIAIGDFNVNPFETLCISASVMHGIPYREEVVKKPNRIVQKNTYQKFYNPTWKFFGNTEAPYTTYYFDNSGRASNYYWNAFDQLMIRPTLVDAFDESTFKIIKEAGNHMLLKDQKPDRIGYSDHLPLFCSFKEDSI